MPDIEGSFTNRPDAPPSTIWFLVEQAQELRRGGDRRGSLATFRRALELDPAIGDVRLEAARELIALGALEEALSELEKVLERSPDHGWAALEKGLILLRLSRPSEALIAFETALRRLPANLDLIHIAVGAAREIHAYDLALTLARRAVRLAPDDPATLIKLAEVLSVVDKKGVQELVLAARDLDRFSPGLARFLAAEADQTWASALLDQDLPQAIVRREMSYVAATADVLRSGPRARRLLDVLASSQLALGQSFKFDDILAEAAARLCDWDTALSAGARAVRLFPESVQTRLKWSNLLWAAGQKARAVHELAPLAADPDVRCAALTQALVFAGEVGAWELAVTFAERLDAIGAHSLEITLQRAIALAHVTGLESALRALDQLGGTWNRAEPALAARLHLLRVFGRHADALKVDLGDFPHRDPSCWAEASGLMTETGQVEAAEALLAQSPSSTPQALALIEQRRGELAEGRRDYASAKDHYAAAVELFPTQDGRVGLARCHLLQMDVIAATQHARTALALGAPAGAVRNLSQSHLGQLIEEFSIDPEVVTAAVAALASGPSARLSALRTALLDAPDQTAPAIMLLLEMRRAGSFPQTLTSTKRAQRAIPKTLIQYWDQAEPPADVKQLMMATRARNPTWRAQLFEFRSALEFIRGAHPRSVVQAFVRAATPQAQADVFRLAYLAAEGGVWCDADNIALSDLSSLIQTEATLFAYQDVWGAIANDMVGAAPGHPVIVEALERCVQALNRGDHEAPWIRSGPGLLSRAFARTWAAAPDGSWVGKAQVLERSEALLAFSIHHPAAYKRGPSKVEEVEEALRAVLEASAP